MFLIVGLGNPGSRYSHTYHNMGFDCIDKLAVFLNAAKFKDECLSLTAKCFFEENELILAKPQTFMNLSGDAVEALLKRYKIPMQNLIVVFDDVDIERGEIRTRMSGSGGTHNGMRHIVEVLQSRDFKRVRIGIGKPEDGENLADYVLSRPAFEYKDIMADAVNKAAEAVLGLLNDKF